MALYAHGGIRQRLLHDSLLTASRYKQPLPRQRQKRSFHRRLRLALGPASPRNSSNESRSAGSLKTTCSALCLCWLSWLSCCSSFALVGDHALSPRSRFPTTVSPSPSAYSIRGGGLRIMRNPVTVPAASASSSIGPPPTMPDASSVSPRQAPSLHQVQLITVASDSQVSIITRRPRDTDWPSRLILRSAPW